MELTSENVTAVVMDCLYRAEELSTDKEVPQDAVRGEGIRLRCGFHPTRLAAHKEDIRSMLLHLPHTFRASEGGGWSFLEACRDEEGELWGQHRDIDALMVLGLASGLISIVPRKMWAILPGGVPYFTVLDKEV